MHRRKSSKLFRFIADETSLLYRFLYTLLVCMDANFRLKNNLVSNLSTDPGLWNGMAYMMPRSPYETYVLSQADAEDVSSFSFDFVYVN